MKEVQVEQIQEWWDATPSKWSHMKDDRTSDSGRKAPNTSVRKLRPSSVELRNSLNLLSHWIMGNNDCYFFPGARYRMACYTVPNNQHINSKRRTVLWSYYSTSGQWVLVELSLYVKHNSRSVGYIIKNSFPHPGRMNNEYKIVNYIAI